MRNDKDVTVELRTFVAKRYDQNVMEVAARIPETIGESEECEFYFYDSYVGIVDGKSYPFGPKLNKSQKYYRGGAYYPDVDIFRRYYMRCFGWSEEIIQNPDSDSFRSSMFSYLTKEEFPNGLILVNNEIKNPRGGVILSVKETIETEQYPSDEEIRRYRSVEE